MVSVGRWSLTGRRSLLVSNEPPVSDGRRSLTAAGRCWSLAGFLVSVSVRGSSSRMSPLVDGFGAFGLRSGHLPRHVVTAQTQQRTNKNIRII